MRYIFFLGRKSLNITGVTCPFAYPLFIKFYLQQKYLTHYHILIRSNASCISEILQSFNARQSVHFLVGVVFDITVATLHSTRYVRLHMACIISVVCLQGRVESSPETTPNPNVIIARNMDNLMFETVQVAEQVYSSSL